MSYRTEDKNAVPRCLILSLIFHASLILVIISINNSSILRSNLIVVDFTIEDSGNAVRDNTPGSESKPRHGSIVRTMNLEASKQSSIREQRAKIKESEIESVPVTTRDVEYVASAETKVLRDADETVSDENSGVTMQGVEDISHKDQRVAVGSSSAYGGVMGGVGTGTREVSGGGIGKADYWEKNMYLRANFAYIRDMIQKKVVYPTVARKMGWEGKVTVSFVIFSDGLTRDLRVMKSSSIDVLDKSAIEAVKDASPFPKPPAEAQIVIPIVYRLN